MKVALVHDWLIHMRGGEKVLEALAEIYPEATIFTLFYDRKKLSPSLAKMRIQASWLHYLPGIRRFYRWLLPILPSVIRSIKIPSVDLVISTSHCVAKGIPIPAGAFHVCYCHTPMRYAWGFEEEYFSKFPGFTRSLIQLMLKQLRKWDLDSNEQVHLFIANSENVRQRIQTFYHRDAKVICPPLDTQLFQRHPDDQPEDYYLAVSAFVPYKKVDLVIQTFNRLSRKLLIVGSGPLDETYRRLRQSGQIIFLGSISGPELRKIYAHARALIFPTDEDFGIVPLEAQACGTPVIALNRGGALESVKIGLFFQHQTPEDLSRAVEDFETRVWDRTEIPEKVKMFSKDSFKMQIKDCVDYHWARKDFHAKF